MADKVACGIAVVATWQRFEIKMLAIWLKKKAVISIRLADAEDGHSLISVSINPNPRIDSGRRLSALTENEEFWTPPSSSEYFWHVDRQSSANPGFGSRWVTQLP